MRRRLAIRVFTLALASFAALPSTAHPSAGPATRSTAGACAAAHARVSSATLEVARRATVCLLNRERAARGLAPLRLHPTLTRVAERHARDMVRNRYFAHVSRDGRSPFDRMLATRYVGRGAHWLLGENIGWGTRSLAEPASLVKAWMRSPGHRRNILNGRFRDVGVGIALGVPEPRFAGQHGATYTTDFGAVS